MRLTDELRSAGRLFSGLTFYERFEHAVVLILTVLIVCVVASATWHLSLAVLALLFISGVDPANPQVFQAVFGMIMTVLIALEFNHSILRVLERKHGIIQVRTVVLIALLALVRKFIILDATKVEALTLLGLAAAVLALGSVYWLVRDQDRRDASEDSPG